MKSLRACALAMLTTMTVLLGACTAPADGPATPDGASGDGFPVTIDSSHGQAVIESAPERIVTLGQGSAETSIALGHIPVGMEEYAWAADETGYLPWIHQAVTEKGGDLPALVGAGEKLDMEKILELEPDVILAPWSGITKEQFDTLNAIAPTVSYPDQAWSVDWDEQIKIIGRALGQEADAQKLIDDLNSQLEKAAASHPEYADHTFSYVYTTPDTLGVFLPYEQRVAVVRALGLTVDPAVNDMKEVEGTDSAIIGYENADQLANSDLIFTFYSDEAAKKQALDNDLYASIPAIKKGAVVASDDPAFVTASSMINPLTLPYALDRYAPLIDDAIAKAK
ncbi:iron-siderophore ABC transporter substrate-binding protein [Propionibacteriaceae bacterium Y1700]|uniref:iron-siderophore ABC transporter substrate-binding protein n=1 Tax=Microlunatus sp. Y1700 TaxID=3418487 RepID=UPI003DA71E87